MEYRTAGESHGRAMVALITGVPAGLRVDDERINTELARRQTGYGRGGRMNIESDKVTVLSGVRFSRSIGSPIALTIANRDWDNWTDVMASKGERGDAARITAPRPGHADLSGCLKTGTDDVRDVLERASARETAARVAAGAVAKLLLEELGVGIISWVESIGDASCGKLDPASVVSSVVEASDVRCPDEAAASRMRAVVDAAKESGETVGGTFTVVASGVLPGLGGYASALERLDGRLAGALMSVPAIKGVEVGDGFALAGVLGSAAHDPIVWEAAKGYGRTSNHAGGLEGGMSNGQDIVLRAAMKPIPTLMKPLASVDMDTHARVEAAVERSDVCAVPAAAVVAEAEVAMVLADAYVAKFGGDCMDDLVSAVRLYAARIAG